MLGGRQEAREQGMGHPDRPQGGGVLYPLGWGRRQSLPSRATCEHLGHVVGIGAQNGLQPIGLTQQLGHGARVLPHILRFLTPALLIEEPGQVLTKAELHLQAPQGTVKPV